MDWVLAEGGVLFATVVSGDGARLPAAPMGAARKGADGVKVLMSWVFLPMGWFASPRDHHARAQSGLFRGTELQPPNA